MWEFLLQFNLKFFLNFFCKILGTEVCKHLCLIIVLYGCERWLLM